MPRGIIDLDWLRKLCLSFPHTTEQIQWGDDLLFKVHGKMFAITPLEPARVCLYFKCSDETFADLTERPHVIHDPYLARAQWIALKKGDAIKREELAELLRASYALVVARLTMKLRLKAKSGAHKRLAGQRPRPDRNP